MTYDKNGNILKLLRSGQISTGVFGRLDSLTYKYTGMGNQVRSIADSVPDVAGRGDFYDGTNGYSAQEYFYDLNGNTIKNDNKKMSTLYNYLNLPSRIYETNTPANKIEYVYTSAGEKLKQRLSTGTTLLYFGNYVYTLDGTANGIAVKYILTQEGRATYSGGAYTYEYFMKDHLGNTRVSFNVPSTTAVIVQQNDYYPFGMMHQPRATTTSDSRYLFNGKELQNNLLGGINLDLYDYSSRYYDPQIGRFTTIDLMTESTDEITPYHYCLNNPVINIDPTGMWSETAMGYTTYNQYEIAEFMRSMISKFSTTTTDQERKEKKKEEEKDKKRQEQKQKEEKEKLIEEEKHKLPELSEEDEEFLMGAIIGGAGGIMRVGRFITGVNRFAKLAKNLSIRTDIVLTGGRSGQLVKSLTGPANSVVKGGQGRIFITDKTGKVIWDITKERAKSVIPGKGFGPKVAPTQEQLNLLKKVWGN